MSTAPVPVGFASFTGDSGLPMLAIVAALVASVVLAVLWLAGFLAARPANPVTADGPQPRPPLLWRWGAPLIDPLAAHLGTWLAAHTRFAILDRLRRAGLEAVLGADRYAAGKVLAGAIGIVVVSVALILLLALLLLLQLWLYLPRQWRSAPLGQIVSYTLASLGGWLVAWLVLVLALAAAQAWWGITPRPVDGLAKVAACDGTEDVIAGPGNRSSQAYQLGYAYFSPEGDWSGYNPCDLVAPVVPTTWSAIKGQYAR